MAGTILSGTYFSTVYLTDPATNPVVVASSATIKGVTGIGLQGTTSAAWAIDNFGTFDTAANIAAIELLSGGSVTNEVGGTIGGLVYILGAAGTVINDSTMVDVRLRAGGTVSNASGATLHASSIGIYATGAVATIVNAGGILDTGFPNFGVGVSLNAGGQITNTSSGTITGGGNAIFARTVAATVTNAGMIIGTFGSGVYLFDGGAVTNQSGAQIVGGLFGIRVLNGTGTVDNSGTIHITRVGSEDDGVALHGGTLINRSGGAIYGYKSGAYVGSGGTVVNAGFITANATFSSPSFSYGDGVFLTAGGVVTNASGGTIAGLARGVFAKSAASTIINSGLISGSTASGISLLGGGVITNTSSGTITGGGPGASDGIRLYDSSGAAGLIVNQGTITDSGTFGYGIKMLTGGTIINAAGALVSAYIGIDLINAPTALTLVNAGTISAASGYGVRFGAAANNRLIDDPGAVFVGTVQAFGYPGAQYTALELASGAAHGTISGIGTQYTGFGRFTVDSGAYWVMTGSNSAFAVSTFTNQGTLKLTSAIFTDPGVLVNNGVVSIDPSTLTVTSLLGTGGVTIGADSTLIAQGTVAAGETITFAGTHAYLELTSPSGFAGTIDGLGANAHILFGGGTTITGGTILTGNTLELFVSGGGTIDLQLNPADDFSGQTITAGAGGVSLGVACFRAGTRITTPRGEVMVEQLAIGDQVITLLDGDAVPRAVTWLGWRVIDCHRHPRPRDVWPVRVRQGAFAPNVPCRDLWLSPNHAVYADDVLIPIRRLVNGDSIRQEKIDRVVYYHIELEQHDVLLAEGLPCETYLDTGDRADFANGGPMLRLYPSFTPLMREGASCAPLRMVGPEVARVRAALGQRARLAATDTAAMTAQG